MFSVICRRLLSGLVLLWAATTVVFLFLHINPESIARSVLGTSATTDQVQQEIVNLGLDRPLFEQYFQWLGGLLTGSLGKSYSGGQDVIQLVLGRSQVTLSLVVCSLVLTAVSAVLLGVLAARKRGWIDRAVQAVAILGTALPGFWVALVLVTTFAVNLHWFPATGYTKIDADSVKWLRGLILPVIALAIGGISGVALQVRSAVIEVSQRDFVRTLISHGLPPQRILFRHVLRNAASPALVILSTQFVGMLSGAVVVEQIFAMPGLGMLAVSSTTKGDIPIVMGVVTVTVTMVTLVNLVVDLTAAWLNPKVRLR